MVEAADLSITSGGSFKMLPQVEVTFVLPNESFQQSFACAPDYGALWKTTHTHLKGTQRIDLFMDDQRLTNTNTKRLMRDAMCCEDASPGLRACIVLDVVVGGTPPPTKPTETAALRPVAGSEDASTFSGSRSVRAASSPGLSDIGGSTAADVAERSEDRLFNLFGDRMSKMQLRSLIAEGGCQWISSGTKLAEEGVPGSNKSIFLIVSGVCEVMVGNVRAAELGAGSIVGEVSSDKAPVATVTARNCVRCFGIKNARAWTLFERDPGLRATIQEIVDDIFEKQVKHAIAEVSGPREGEDELLAAFSKHLTKDLVRQLSAQGTVRWITCGTRLAEQGYCGDERSLHLIMSGRCDITVDGVLAGEVGPSGVVGETTFLTGKVSSATVTARGSVRCFSILNARAHTLSSQPAMKTAIQGILNMALVAKIESMHATTVTSNSSNTPMRRPTAVTRAETASRSRCVPMTITRTPNMCFDGKGLELARQMDSRQADSFLAANCDRLMGYMTLDSAPGFVLFARHNTAMVPRNEHNCFTIATPSSSKGWAWSPTASRQSRGSSQTPHPPLATVVCQSLDRGTPVKGTATRLSTTPSRSSLKGQQLISH